MLAKVTSAAIIGIEAVLIRVEVDLSRGLPSFDIVGLPDKAVRESRERVRAAIKNSGFEFPLQRITINLAPADIKKIGPHFDLPIAVGILSASGILTQHDISDFLIAGELSLSGNIRKIKGVLPMALIAAENKIEGIIIPENNFQEAALVDNLQHIAVDSLQQVTEFMYSKQIVSPLKKKVRKEKRKNYQIDFSEIKGQSEAKRALEIAAAGSHNVLMIGPPGTGKTMLARRLPTILPPLTSQEALELTKIYSIMGLVDAGSGLVEERPFRSPHHSITNAALLGGGRIPEPGEVSLAHQGMLFLDEIPEYKREVLELLRLPLEKKEITIARTEMSVTFPADFMLVSAMNPCPCGYYTDNRHQCNCTVPEINRYRGKISGPLMGRIDIHIEVPALNIQQITGDLPAESSEKIAHRVENAHRIQLERYQKEKFSKNARLKGKTLQKYCKLGKKEKVLIKQAIASLALSARAYDKILKLARTIADLDKQRQIKEYHLAEAIQYRSFDRTMLC